MIENRDIDFVRGLMRVEHPAEYTDVKFITGETLHRLVKAPYTTWEPIDLSLLDEDQLQKLRDRFDPDTV